jgi:hypothetical protein
MAKIATRGKKNIEDAVAMEERWVVVGDENNARPNCLIYLLSEKGIEKAEAERLAAKLDSARAVPFLALDERGYYNATLHENLEEQ